MLYGCSLLCLFGFWLLLFFGSKKKRVIIFANNNINIIKQIQQIRALTSAVVFGK